MKKIIPVLLVSSFSFACPVGKSGLSKDEFKKQQHHQHARKVSQKIKTTTRLPSSLPTGNTPEAWGGPDSTRWRPEAILANAASLWLNTGWDQGDVVDVLVSVPVKMIFTNERVYGDGQTNASLQFGDWNFDHPQVVGTLIRTRQGDRRVVLSFSKKMQMTSVKVVSFAESGGKVIRHDKTLSLKAQDDRWLAGWVVPKDVAFGDLEKSRVVWIEPTGWDSAFPLDFRMVITTKENLLAEAGSAMTAGETPLDPLNVLGRSQAENKIPQDILLNSVYGSEWVKNDQGRNELRNESIHGEIHSGGQTIATAVGGGLTWLVDKGPGSTFKNLYTCFDARNGAKEATYGVPSGGGWHEIGDAAETIINDMEAAPVSVGFATGLPAPNPPDGKKFAWGLSDVATIRLLQPGEAIVTAAGDQTWKEDEAFRSRKDGSQRGTESSGGGRNYHWFFFDNANPTCTQEWVHSCRPTLNNNLGLRCD